MSLISFQWVSLEVRPLWMPLPHDTRRVLLSTISMELNNSVFHLFEETNNFYNTDDFLMEKISLSTSNIPLQYPMYSPVMKIILLSQHHAMETWVALYSQQPYCFRFRSARNLRKPLFVCLFWLLSITSSNFCCLKG